MNEIPCVEAVLEKPKGAPWSWVVRECPYCGEGHRHEVGRVSDDPQCNLGVKPAPYTETLPLSRAKKWYRLVPRGGYLVMPEEVELLQQVIAVAEQHHGGHFSLFRFTTG